MSVPDVATTSLLSAKATALGSPEALPRVIEVEVAAGVSLYAAYRGKQTALKLQEMWVAAPVAGRSIV